MTARASQPMPEWVARRYTKDGKPVANAQPKAPSAPPPLKG